MERRSNATHTPSANHKRRSATGRRDAILNLAIEQSRRSSRFLISHGSLPSWREPGEAHFAPQLKRLIMDSSLFRPQAIAFQTQYRDFGQVGRFQTTSLKALSWVLAIAVGLSIVFVCLAGYTRKETVSGYLAPATGSAEIFVPQQGTVTAVYASQDQVVSRGDVLLTIDTSQLTADGLDVNATILKSLSVQKILLTSQVEAENRAARAEKDRLAAAISSGEAELAQLSSQMGFQQEQIDIGEKLVASAKKMNAKGYFSAPELYKRQEDLLEARQALSSLKQRYTARETELAQTRTSLQQLPTEFGSKTPTPSERIGAGRATHRRSRLDAELSPSVHPSRAASPTSRRRSDRSPTPSGCSW